MNKKLIATIVATALVVPLAAHAEATLYGSVRAGVVSGDDDATGSSNRLDFGSTGNNGSVGGQGLYSRIGIKASNDLGNGSSAGLLVERGVGASALSTRHTNVWVGGSWGKLTLGQQGNPYRNARKWDQTWFLGGQFGADGGSRIEGLKYSVSSGPFSFSAMAEANDASDDEAAAVAAKTTTVHYYTADPGSTSRPAAALTTGTRGDVPLSITGTTTNAGFTPADAQPTPACSAASSTCAFGYVFMPVAADTDPNNPTVVDPSSITRTRTDTAATPAKSNDGVDSWTVTAGYDFGAVNLDVSHRAVQITDKGFDNTAVGINGSVGPFGWYLAYQTASDNTSAKNDVDSIGGFASFSLSERDTLYLYHVSHEADKAGAFGSKTLGKDPSETILGYSHSLGGGVSFIGEYLSLDKDTNVAGSEPSVLALALKVDF